MQKLFTRENDTLSNWKSYPKNRKIKKFDGYVVIVPSSYSEIDSGAFPLFCQTCETRMTSLDEDSQKEFGCCSMCADTWAYANKKAWKEGWRPDRQQVEAAASRRIFADDNIRIE